jgi:DUF1009 family protein
MATLQSTIRPARLATAQQASASARNQRVGVLAGWGRYPLIVAEKLRAAGFRVYGQGIKDHADPALAELCDEFHWVGLGKFGSAARWFCEHDVRQATMAGKVHKVVLFQPAVWLRHLPDWRTIRCFWPHFVSARKDKKDDTLLSAVIEAFAMDGIHFAPATDFAPELLVQRGLLTTGRPTTAQLKDIAFGWQMAKEMGRLDVGQSVVVKGQAVLAVEAIEGTDECIRRAGQLCRAREFTVVKVAKPQQDMRFDVPTIGVGTLRTMAEAGARVLAIEAGKTIVLDEPEVVEFANRHGLIVVACDESGHF